jgi:hypothetical protein
MSATVTGLLAQRPSQYLSSNPSPVTNILAQFARLLDRWFQMTAAWLA